MKQFLLGIVFIAIFGAALQAFGAQSTIYPYTSPLQSNKNVAGKNNFNSVRDDANTDIQAMRNAQQSMNTEIYTSLDGKELKSVVQASAPADTTIDWYDTDQEPGVLILKRHNGTTWVRASSHGVQYLSNCASIAAGMCVDTDDGKLYYHNGSSVVEVGTSSGSYPSAGIALSTGSAWGSSLTLDTDLSTVSASDDSMPSAKATKAAIDALPFVLFGTGFTVAEDTPSVGTDTVSVTANTYQAYDTDLTTWAGVTPGTGVTTALSVNTGTTGGVPTIVASGAYTVDTASISANTCASAVAVPASGVTTTDTVIATPNAILSSIAGFGVTAAGAVRVDVYPTDVDGGKVNFQFCNPTGAAIDPGSVTFIWKVLR